MRKKNFRKLMIAFFAIMLTSLGNAQDLHITYERLQQGGMTGSTSGIADVNSASTTYTMGSVAATVTATYKAATPPDFLTLSSNGEHFGASGGSVTIIATSSYTQFGISGSGSAITHQSLVANGNNATITITVAPNTGAARSATVTISSSGLSATITITQDAAGAPPSTTYALTVNSGTGSGRYTAGTAVPIAANAAPSGQVFDKWTGATTGIADVTAPTTTFTMGSAAATVTATYKPQSGDNKLSSMAIADVTLSPAFSRNIYMYTATVANGIESISIDATPNDAKATVTGTGTHSLNTGANKITITVTAENGSTQDYVVMITRNDIPSSNDEVSSSLAVWAAGSVLHVKTDNTERIQVINLSGQIVKDESVPTGETTYYLTKGIYVVKTSKKSFKAIIR